MQAAVTRARFAAELGSADDLVGDTAAGRVGLSHLDQILRGVQRHLMKTQTSRPQPGAAEFATNMQLGDLAVLQHPVLQIDPHG